MSRIADQLVCHERYNRAKADLELGLERARQGDPQIQSLVGGTRNGKSTTVDQFHREQVALGAGEHEIIRVISPKHLTGRALPDACLASIGMSPAVFHNHVAATNALIQTLKRLKTRLIIFDETQHLLERGSSTTVRAAGDFLKLLYDQAGVGLVLVGLPTLTGLFSANEQLADRARRPFEYYPYYWEGPDYKSFRAALASALEYLREAGWDTFAYNDAEFARRMYAASAGRYGLIHKLLLEVQAAHGNRKTAFYPEFAEAYAQAVINRWLEFNPLDPARPIETEHMALVYASVMREAGVVR